jgi:hypothetical protein
LFSSLRSSGEIVGAGVGAAVGMTAHNSSHAVAASFWAISSAVKSASITHGELT